MAILLLDEFDASAQQLRNTTPAIGGPWLTVDTRSQYFLLSGTGYAGVAANAPLGSFNSATVLSSPISLGTQTFDIDFSLYSLNWAGTYVPQFGILVYVLGSPILQFSATHLANESGTALSNNLQMSLFIDGDSDTVTIGDYGVGIYQDLQLTLSLTGVVLSSYGAELAAVTYGTPRANAEEIELYLSVRQAGQFGRIEVTDLAPGGRVGFWENLKESFQY